MSDETTTELPRQITIAFDGACHGNPGPGGYGAILINDRTGAEKVMKGHEAATTNNKMELSAAIAGLNALTTVIGHQRERGWILVDAGWMALSRDRGTAAQAVDQGYGVVCDADGRVLPDLIVRAANQEHGILALRPGSPALLPDLALGTRLRILPNHACATGTQFDAYDVIPAEAGAPLARWPRFRGW